MRSKQTNRPSRAVIRLASGVRLDGVKEKDATLVLMSPEGKVRLNRSAAAILRLCDGSRNREDVVAEVLRESHGQIRAVEITEFLDVARRRGWISE